MNPLTQSKNTTNLPVLIALTLVCFGLSPQARAVCQEGCLTNENTVLGDDALISLTTGFNNTAVGASALLTNTSGIYNTANGWRAPFSNTAGGGNTAIGSDTLLSNTTGYSNTATGEAVLLSNTTGYYNTANGQGALQGNTEGVENTAVGVFALLNNLTGSRNIALGANAGTFTTGSHNIDIGNLGVIGESRTIRVGMRRTHRAAFIAGISGATVPTGVAVIVDGSGHLGTTTSSAHFKDAIKPMDRASEVILALKPVTFHYKQEIDPEGIPQFGLVAEDVEKVNPDLVAHDE